MAVRELRCLNCGRYRPMDDMKPDKEGRWRCREKCEEEQT